MNIQWKCETEGEFLTCCGTAGLGYYRHDLWRMFEPLSVDDRRRMLDMAVNSLDPEHQVRILIECFEAGVPLGYAVLLLPGFDTADPVIRLYKSGVSPGYFIAVADTAYSRMASGAFDYVMKVHAAGVPAEYAVACASRFGADETAAMWQEGISLEYAGELT